MASKAAFFLSVLIRASARAATRARLPQLRTSFLRSSASISTQVKSNYSKLSLWSLKASVSLLSPHRKQCSDSLARRDPRDDSGAPAVCDYCWDAACRRKFYCIEFRDHAAHREPAFFRTNETSCVRDISDHRNPFAGMILQSVNAHSGGDRTAGDDDAFASATNELRHIGSETAKLFVIECVGARPSENAGAEFEENAPGFPVHAELLHKPENESAQKQFPRFYQTAIITATEISGNQAQQAVLTCEKRYDEDNDRSRDNSARRTDRTCEIEEFTGDFVSLRTHFLNENFRFGAIKSDIAGVASTDLVAPAGQRRSSEGSFSSDQSSG